VRGRRLRSSRALRGLVLGIALAGVLWTDVPLRILLVLTLLNLLLRENFPFSHFPMYASFGDFTYYVFVADEHDEPLALRRVFGVSAPFLKKLYDGEVRAHRRAGRALSAMTPTELNRAGLVALTHLWGRAPAGCRLLRLYQVNLRHDGRTVRETRMLVAEMPRP
jgi:hypothetical protein